MEVIGYGIDHITLSITLKQKGLTPVETYDRFHKSIIEYFELDCVGVAGARFNEDMEYRQNGTPTQFTLSLFSCLTRRLKLTTAEEYAEHIHECLLKAFPVLESVFETVYRVNKVEYFIDWQKGQIRPFKKTIKSIKPSTTKLTFSQWENGDTPSSYYAKANGWELVRYNKTKQLIDERKTAYYPHEYADIDNPVYRTELRLFKDYIQRHDEDRIKTEHIALKLLGNITDTQRDIKKLTASIKPKGTLKVASKPLTFRTLADVEDIIYSRVANEVENVKSAYEAAGIPFDRSEALKRFDSIISGTHPQKNKTRRYKRQITA